MIQTKKFQYNAERNDWGLNSLFSLVSSVLKSRYIYSFVGIQQTVIVSDLFSPKDFPDSTHFQ